jgi:hypothetical protein
LERGLGFWAPRRNRTASSDAVLLGVSWPVVEEDPTGGVHLSVGERGAADTDSVQDVTGPWATSLAGPVRSPRPTFIFLFFLFPFSYFLFSFISSAIFIQINSNHF